MCNYASLFVNRIDEALTSMSSARKVNAEHLHLRQADHLRLADESMLNIYIHNIIV